MPTTFISAIGRGRKDDNGTAYANSTYTIDGIAQPPTPFFAEAWLNSRAGDNIDRVELVGTATSSWSALIEHHHQDDHLLNLWETLETKTEGDAAIGVGPADLDPLAAYCSQHWGKHVRCHILTHREVDDHTASAVLTKLLSILPSSEIQRNVDLDTTHGFRSLPMLALSAVQIADTAQPGFAARTRLVYGELLNFKSLTGRGFALNSITENFRVAAACRIWQQSLDSVPLQEVLSERYQALAKGIGRLGATIHANDFKQLGPVVAQVRNNLKALSKEGDREAWQHSLLTIIHHQLELLDHPSLPQQLLGLAQLRIDCHQYGLAILALSEATTALASPQGATDYEALKEQGRRFQQEKLTPAQSAAWKDLFVHRNRVAHGANLSNEAGKLHSQNIAVACHKHLSFVRQLIQQFGEKL